MKIVEKSNHYQFLFFEIYYVIVSWSMIVYYFWPSRKGWKGRKYP
jgi:hypothetical protein